MDKADAKRVTMRPSVGTPNPEAVLPLLRRLLDQRKNDANRERQPVRAQFEGPQ